MKLYRTSEYWLVEHANAVVCRLSRFDVDAWLDSENPVAYVHHLCRTLAPAHVPVPSSPLMPIGTQEIWAAGVTYQRSKVARMEESVAAKSAYDLVYDAPRPELFFKGNPRRCRSTGEPMRLRDDSKWMVPEPELALVLSSRGQIVGYTIGNDLSCRDIEGENLLYLPQAKTWDGSCSLGPAILLADPADDIRSATIKCTITRNNKEVFAGETSLSQIKRPLEELVGYLFRNQTFPQGVVLLTGTGIVPNHDFTLTRGDTVRISIDKIGTLENPII
jgi:2-dehydro-3-deoxy-D-arabinonate dehydratase